MYSDYITCVQPNISMTCIHRAFASDKIVVNIKTKLLLISHGSVIIKAVLAKWLSFGLNDFWNLYELFLTKGVYPA